MLVRCRNIACCDEDYVKTCPHAVPHDPMPIEAEDPPFICTEKASQCNPGWSEFSPVICEPLDRKEEALYWLEKLHTFIEEEQIADEEADDGDGHIDRWRSGEFTALLVDIKQFLQEKELEGDCPSNVV